MIFWSRVYHFKTTCPRLWETWIYGCL